MKRKLPVAISACLLGNKVRYDGQCKHNHLIIEELSKFFEFQVICPEVDMGLSVPRPPMHLQLVDGKVRAVDIEDDKIDYTDRLKQHAQNLLPSLCHVNAYIFKSKSPSCGVGTTPLKRDYTNGIFAQEIVRSFPNLPIIDDSQLSNAKNCRVFLRTVIAYADATD